MSIVSRTFLLLVPLLSLVACASTRPPDRLNAFSSVAFSPDHSLLAFADAREIQVLYADSRVHVVTLRQLPPDTEGADPLDFRHGVGDTMVFLDNDRIATTGMGGLVSVWDIRSGIRLSVIDPPTKEAFASSIDFSPVANRLIIGTRDGEVLLTTMRDGIPDLALLPVAKLEGYVWDLQFSEEGRYFATASMETAIPDDASGGEATTNAAAGQLNENSSPASGDQIPGQADSSNVAIWDAELLNKVGDLEGAREVYKMALVPGERSLLTAGDEVRVWEFLTLEQADQVSDPSLAMQRIGVGSLVAVSILGMAAGAAVGAPFMMVDPLTAFNVFSLPVALMVRPEACSRSVAISPDGQTIVSTTRGPSHNVMAVIDRDSDKVVEKWTADLYVCDMAFSPDGKYLLTATASGVDIYDTTDWKKKNLN